jgi:hypothetical protein
MEDAVPPKEGRTGRDAIFQNECRKIAGTIHFQQDFGSDTHSIPLQGRLSRFLPPPQGRLPAPPNKSMKAAGLQKAMKK